MMINWLKTELSALPNFTHAYSKFVIRINKKLSLNNRTLQEMFKGISL